VNVIGAGAQCGGSGPAEFGRCLGGRRATPAWPSSAGRAVSPWRASSAPSCLCLLLFLPGSEPRRQPLESRSDQDAGLRLADVVLVLALAHHFGHVPLGDEQRQHAQVSVAGIGQVIDRGVVAGAGVMIGGDQGNALLSSQCSINKWCDARIERGQSY